MCIKICKSESDIESMGFRSRVRQQDKMKIELTSANIIIEDVCIVDRRDVRRAFIGYLEDLYGFDYLNDNQIIFEIVRYAAYPGRFQRYNFREGEIEASSQNIIHIIKIWFSKKVVSNIKHNKKSRS